ncbi:nucleoside triphosphate hydrolase [Roseibium sp.]|uniref:nucleoside triphosphate hydrolase n=1 Tax=Roseibium sp. TaxID=1936156 RepID=UPI003D14C6AF
MCDSFRDSISLIAGFIEENASGPARTIVAVAGPPGSGKSTLAEGVVAALNRDVPGKAVLLPMDGFHLDNEELVEKGLLERKGAPETFDVRALNDLLEKVRKAEKDVSYPVFDRKQDKTIANASSVPAGTRIVVVEGNYLLLDRPPWNGLHGYFDATVFLNPGMGILERRLVDRWLAHGHTLEEARKRALQNDMVNARCVVEHSMVADLTLGTPPRAAVTA